MGWMTIGGGLADIIIDDAGGMLTFRPAAAYTLWDSEVGGNQYLTLRTPAGDAIDGATRASTTAGRIETTDVEYVGDTSPGGAWVECPSAWYGERRWVCAHDAFGGTGGTGGGGSTVFDAIEVTGTIVLGDTWLRTSGGNLQKSPDGETWTTIGTGGGGTVTLPSGLLRVIWASEGVSSLPADIDTGRVLYVNPATGATAPAWLRSGVDLFLTTVTA